MNEFEWSFAADCREKKQIAHSAAHMKRGSRSKACSLPSDTLTAAQCKKLDGECATYYLDKWYSYEDFKKMPTDIQTDYLNHWLERFGIGVSTLGQHFWALSPSTLSIYAKKVGIARKLKHKQGARINPRTERAIRKVVESGVGDEGAAGEDVQIEEAPDVKTDGLPDTPILSARIELNRFDFDAFKLLANMFAGKSVRVNIDVQEAQNGE